MKSILMLLVAATLFSCTKNERVKNFGGIATVNLPENQKLVNVTWKEDDLWYLTKEMTIADSAITYTFKEKSSYGIWNGAYIIIESKTITAPVAPVKPKKINYDSLMLANPQN